MVMDTNTVTDTMTKEKGYTKQCNPIFFSSILPKASWVDKLEFPRNGKVVF